ncbi:unnamed protein product [Protopolystoma xenopodis]|uniref:Uncharacterized protein n=1 Tax=Protopolystoma xenopodis TaxID=117903 RepID=A0A3S5C6Y2_9PLAT|nr:unnamed protein product [Protopolystoma xenopodis]
MSVGERGRVETAVAGNLGGQMHREAAMVLPTTFLMRKNNSRDMCANICKIFKSGEYLQPSQGMPKFSSGGKCPEAMDEHFQTASQAQKHRVAALRLESVGLDRVLVTEITNFQRVGNEQICHHSAADLSGL